MNNCGKLKYLNSVECFEEIQADVDETREKFMITFPYPYMNGKLHLGHLYSLSKADFYSYYMRLKGYNALFPFAFHCTGMPISASAYKLGQELKGLPVDVSVVNILSAFGFTDLEPFTDPVHWIRTFPSFAIESLKKFHASIDWRRSFITTDINKYYDSFVRYQFNKLKNLGLLDFGKRYSIFCPIDQQACLDHDRRRGEGVKPVEAILRKIPAMNETTFLIRSKNIDPIEKIVLSKNKTLVHFRIQSREFIVEDDIFENLKYQVEGVEKVTELNTSELKCGEIKIELIEKDIPGKTVSVDSSNKNKPECREYNEIMNIKNEKLSLVENSDFVKVFVPEELVISRSGGKCVVSLLDQWYIDYGIPEWKSKARKCIERMTLTEDTRAKLNESLEWLNKWGFSRSFGLGTRVPWDRQYLIDSLSDSTIYNAFYTVKHFLFRDLEGNDQIFPAEELCDDVWKYVFGDIDSVPDSLLKHQDLLNKARSSFEYFYPVDLRVSGKDLIGNHLLFYVFNHVALFDEKYWPRRIFTNGHLMLNSAKMSKSDGNYLTVQDALEKFGTSATRMCLADCGDTNEDANFQESTANSFVLKLYTLVKTVESLETAEEDDEKVLVGMMTKIALSEDARYDFNVNEIFLESISKNIRLTIESYENMVFRDVLKYGFYENLRIIELYGILNGSNQTLIKYGYKTVLSLMYPIIPSLSTYLIRLKFDGVMSLPKIYRETEDKIKAIEHVRSVCSKINSLKKNTHSSVEIIVNKEYCEWKRRCMEIVDSSSDKADIIKKVDPVFKEFNVNKGKGMVFCMDYFAFKDKYIATFDELDTFSMFSGYIKESCGLDVSIIEGDQGDPLNPVLRFK